MILQIMVNLCLNPSLGTDDMLNSTPIWMAMSYKFGINAAEKNEKTRKLNVNKINDKQEPLLTFVLYLHTSSFLQPKS